MSLFTSILISGPDARTFLQGQVTCDVNSLSTENPMLGALNSPQGRVQAVLRLNIADGGIVAGVVSTMAERTMQRLRRYVLRSKVTLDFTTAAGDQPQSLLGELRAGIPHVFPETYESFVAQMLNLDLLGAISFDKGCYTGQEIIARTHYRGAIKRRMFHFSTDCTPPLPGARVLSDSQHAGDVVYAVPVDQGCEMLAVVSLAYANAELTLENSAALKPQSLPYEVTAARNSGTEPQ